MLDGIDASFGDIDLDGRVDSLDATLIKLYLLFGKDLTALNNFLSSAGTGLTAHIGEEI